MSWVFPLTALIILFLAIGTLWVHFQRSRATLSASEERFRTLVEQSTDGMFLLNLDGRILDANPHACQSLGYAKEELLKLSLHDIVEDLTDIILPQRPNRFAPGVPSTMEGRHRRRDGTGFPVDIRISIIESSSTELQLLALVRDVSKQKETEELLRQSSQKFEVLFQQAFQLIGLLRPDGTLLEANQTALQLIGCEGADVQERPFWDTPWWNREPKQQRRLRQAIQRAAEGEVVRMEADHPRSDGSRILVDFSLKPILNDRGQVTLLIAEGRDITERVQVANALKTANLALETLFDANPMPIIALDNDQRVTQWNRAAEETFGWRRGEVIGQPYPLAPEEGAEFGPNLRQRVYSGEKLRGVEVVRKKKDGTTIELNLYGSPLCDDTGKVYGLTGIFVDLSERKATEALLRESETRYRSLSQQFEALLEGIPDPILLLSPDLSIIWANRGALENLPPDMKPPSEQTCHALRHNRAHPCPICPVLACFASGKSQEQNLPTPDGRIWGVKAFPLRDQDGNVVNVLEMATDITEKLRMRQEAEQNSRLAALGELAAGVAHEINNPNGLILLNLPALMAAFADLEPIMDAYLDEHPELTLGGLPATRMRHEIPAMFEEMQDGAIRIKRIVEDLKNFVQQDRLRANDEIDLNQALRTAVRLTANEIRRATDHFSSTYSDQLQPVKGVSQRLEQVMVNLLINACQALPDKGRHLSVATRFDTTAGMNVVEIRDQGDGIPERNLSRLTDPFFTTRRESGGTGLGLSVSARIVKEHGGELRFSSAPGQGTTASLLLPPMKGVPG